MYDECKAKWALWKPHASDPDKCVAKTKVANHTRAKASATTSRARALGSHTPINLGHLPKGLF